MQKLFGAAAISALLLASGIVSADEITGPLEHINMEGTHGPTVTVAGKELTLEESAAAELSNFAEGDSVRVIYEEGSPAYASQIEKVE